MLKLLVFKSSATAPEIRILSEIYSPSDSAYVHPFSISL